MYSTYFKDIVYFADIAYFAYFAETGRGDGQKSICRLILFGFAIRVDS